MMIMIYIYDLARAKRTKKEKKDASVTSKIHTERIRQE